MRSRRARLELPGRAALVTGAARGIGLDTARRLAARGCAVALVDRDGDLAAREARALGPSAVALGADVADRAAVQAVVAEAAERLGGLDVVVANAGVSPPSQTLLAMPPEAFDRVVAINLAGVWNTTKAALPHIVERRGHVLVVASMYAAVNGVLAAPYAVSKAAVEALGRALRVELAPHGASAGVAYFGFIDTAMVRDAFARPVVQELMPALPAVLRRPVPVGRPARRSCAASRVAARASRSRAGCTRCSRCAARWGSSTAGCCTTRTCTRRSPAPSARRSGRLPASDHGRASMIRDPACARSLRHELDFKDRDREVTTTPVRRGRPSLCAATGEPKIPMTASESSVGCGRGGRRGPRPGQRGRARG